VYETLGSPAFKTFADPKSCRMSSKSARTAERQAKLYGSHNDHEPTGVGVDEQVLRLDVTVANPASVQVGQATEELRKKSSGA
jgi:hypothetical protein